MERKYRCWECQHRYTSSEELVADNPFKKDVIHGCPKCGTAESGILICSHEGCDRIALSTDVAGRPACIEHHQESMRKDGVLWR